MRAMLFAVGHKLAGRAADDGRIANRPSERRRKLLKSKSGTWVRFHDQEARQSCPQVAPAASTASIVMIGQERVADSRRKIGWSAHPLEPQVKLFVAGVETESSQLALPMRLIAPEPAIKLRYAAKSLDQPQTLNRSEARGLCFARKRPFAPAWSKAEGALRRGESSRIIAMMTDVGFGTVRAAKRFH